MTLSIADYEWLKAQARREGWPELVRQAREQIRAELGDRELTPPEDIIRQMREERETQFLALFGGPQTGVGQ